MKQRQFLVKNNEWDATARSIQLLAVFKYIRKILQIQLSSYQKMCKKYYE